jgi:pSer/pThr/pTyr-binding forkhead associated (FHA) protein
VPNDFVLSSPDGRYRFALPTGAVVKVGRDPQNEFQILDPAVSRHHATLLAQPDGILVTDGGSTAGTRINGHLVAGPVSARTGDVLELGPVLLQVATSDLLLPPPPNDGSNKGSRSKVGQVIAIVGVGAAVLSAVVALLVYLTSRPTSVEQFETAVDQWCTAYGTSYPDASAALDLTNGQWHPERTRELSRDVVDHDERFLARFQDLEPPLELRSEYDPVESTLRAMLAEDKRWVTRLQKMSDREVRRYEPLRVPAYTSKQAALGRELTAGLSELSGGQCQPQQQ